MKISISDNKSYFEPVQVNSVAELAQYATQNHYSTGVFQDNHRKISNFLEAECIALDIDNDEGSEFTIDQAKDLFKDYKHLIMPSKSHLKRKGNKGKRHRFRVILFLDSPVTDSKDFKATWYKLKDYCPHIDDACKDSSRFFYPSPEVYSIREDGKLWPLTKFVAPKQIEAPVQAEGRGDLSKDTLRFLLEGAPEGKRNVSLFKAAKDMQEQGYTKVEVIARLQRMIDGGGSWATDKVNEKDIECINNVFSNDPLYDKRETPKRNSIFNFQSVDDLIEEAGEINWLVDNLVTSGGLGLMVGPPKAGKSTIIRQLVKSICRNEPFFNRRVSQGSVLYMTFEEQPAVLKQQFEAVGITGKDPVTMHVGSVFAPPEMVLDDLEAAILDFNPRLVILDTLFDIMQIENINDYGQVKKTLAMLREVARRTETHILGVHHTNKGGEGNASVMGSNAIHGAVDVLIRVVQQGDRRYLFTNGKHGLHFSDQEIIYNPKTMTYELGNLGGKRDEL